MCFNFLSEGMKTQRVQTVRGRQMGAGIGLGCGIGGNPSV